MFLWSKSHITLVLYFFNIFLEKSAIVLTKQTNINRYTINLEKGK